eukprot:GHVS01031178.1.p1 GENE.GHVS01031178.1~~GHVS01031178.1.p1  ORF type:complete len:537 (-),score=126.42 GHVS01031178.1:272-1882(-)
MPGVKRESSAMSGGSSSSPTCEVPFDHDVVKAEIIKATDDFLRRQNLRIKIRKLPLPPDTLLLPPGGGSSSCTTTTSTCSTPLPASSSVDVSAPSSSTTTTSPPSTTTTTVNGTAQQQQPVSSEGSTTPPGGSSNFGVYHFVTRQKRHMIEQLLRNRSTYLTQFNTMNLCRNRKSPFVLKTMSDPILEGLHKMSNDFDDPEFTGVWLSLHTQPFVTDTQFGNLARSKIVGWALIEVLTTNERCLKALWIHPKLSPGSATFLLRGFLPRVLLEAFHLEPPPDSTCSWKFFYTWANDFESLPRQTWLMLTSRRWLGLPRHFDINSTQHADDVLGIEGEEVSATAAAGAAGGAAGGEEEEGVSSSRTSEVTRGEEEGDEERRYGDKRSSITISTGVCGCMKNPKWSRVDEVLVGCSESSLYKKWRAGGLVQFIPETTSKSLLDDIEELPNDKPHDEEEEEGKEDETDEVIRKEELVGLSDEDVAKLLKYIWGTDDAKNRVRGGVDELIKTVVVEEPGGTGENTKRAKVKQQRAPRGGGT